MWLSIYFPLLPLEVFESAEPKTKPLAISEDQHILLCNSHALALGIEPGLTTHTALSIHNNISIKNRGYEKELELLNKLALLSYQFSSEVVAYTNQHKKHSLLMEIAGSIRLFNGLNSLLSQIHHTFQNIKLAGFNHSTGFEHQFAIAKTSKAAELLARNPLDTAYKKNCLEHDLPIIKADLSNTPLSLLDCSPKTILQCQDMGLDKVGELLAIPLAALGKRFNKEFVGHLGELQGSESSLFSWFIPDSTFKKELFYIDGLRSHNDLLCPVKKLLKELGIYLRQRQLTCIALTWKFTRFSKQKNHLQLQFSQPQNNYENLFLLTQLQLDQVPLDSPVESIELHASQFSPVDAQSLDFFSQNNQRGDPSLLADKITGKLGEGALKKIQLYNHHFPEHQNQLQSWQSVSCNRNTLNEASKCSNLLFTPNSPSLPRPGWLLETPLLLKQKNLTIYQGKHPLTIIKGPERIEGNWWNTKSSRDYFIAATTGKGSCSDNPGPEYHAFYWIYHDRIEKNWYLHGIFS